MNFNKAVNIKSNLYKTFSVSTNGRRLLASGVPAYQIIVVDSQTVQIIFPPGTSYSNYNIQIINPQNVQDANGNLPSFLVAQIQVDINNIYSSSISNAPNSFPLYFTFLSVICIVSFLFDIELMKFLQILYIHYFIVINLPPIFIKVFIGLRLSTLSYLPMVFSVPNPVLRPNVPSNIYNTIGDYSFLRNAGFAFTPLIIILIVWGLVKLLSVAEINRFKTSRVWFQQLLSEKFKYAVIL